MNGRRSVLDACGCCEAGSPRPEIFNPPGQPSLAYRVGTHSSFMGRMLAQLPAEEIHEGRNHGTRPLAALATRAVDDPAIALLDGAATVLDILSFYTERIATEGYLRTATERRSVLELARAIGYELRPGVAANAFLAFTVEDAPGSPGVATVPEGTPVQSVPPQGKLPQTFETGEDLEARAEWNELRPRLTQPQLLAVDGGKLMLIAADGSKLEAKQLVFAGTDTGLKAGDQLLAAVAAEPEAPLDTALVEVLGVHPDPERERTVVHLEETTLIPSFLTSLLAGTSTFLFGGVSELAGAVLQESALQAYLNMSGFDIGELVAGWTPAKPAPAPQEGVFAFRSRLGLFGHNAPAHSSLPTDGTPFPNDWDDAGGTRIWERSDGSDYSDDTPADAFLERVVPEVVRGGWVVFRRSTTEWKAYVVGETTEASLADFALSGRCTGLGLAAADGGEPDKPAAFKVRNTTAHVQSERLELGELPIEDSLAPGDVVLALDRMVKGLEPGRAVVLRGKRVDAPKLSAEEVLVLANIVHAGGYTTLHFEKGLERGYIRETVTVNANVVAATQGETVSQVLGGGDGGRGHQRFVLARPPLTYVSAPTPGGTKSTLEVRVNGLLWHEAPSLYGHAATEEIYIARQDDDGKTTLTFGDGKHGARLPSGAQNVTAVYRCGIGRDGEVGAGALSLLQARPLGIREVANPRPATGAQGPEHLEDARVNAPVTVRTLERIVSLQDFEDFAGAFAGIGKAQAVPLWNGDRLLVHITVAGDGGSPVEPSSPVLQHLADAVDAARDPSVDVQIAGHQPVFFDLSAGILLDPRYEREPVEKAVREALGSLFGFQSRDFGQPVSAAEVMSAIQHVPGVAATDLDLLYIVTEPEAAAEATAASVLPAAVAHWENGAVVPAELLLVNEAGITLTGMSE